MFPPANATIYYNEAGEPIGWDAHNDYGDADYDDNYYLADEDESEDEND